MSSIRILALLSIVAVMVAVVGCGGGAPAPMTESDASLKTITSMLEGIAANGLGEGEEVGETLAEMEDLAAEVGDPAKADAVKKAVAAIGEAADDEAAKAAAQEALSKL
jgi:hypothetical protein